MNCKVDTLGVIRMRRMFGVLFATACAPLLVATAAGLAAAIPAAVFYNYFGHLIREFGARMEDFSLEFLNLMERTFS